MLIQNRSVHEKYDESNKQPIIKFIQFQYRRICIIGIRHHERFAEALAAFLLFFIYEITDALETPNVRSIPLKLLRSS